MTSVYQRYFLSPERLYLDCWTRYFLRQHLDLTQVKASCNVGIGVGEFDDWLGHHLTGHAKLTSVDIDHTVVAAFRERQRRHEHPNPSVVVHGDLMQASLGPFDLVTMVGSTASETHAPARALQCAQDWVRPGGWFYTTLMHSISNPRSLMAELRGELIVEEFTAMEESGFTAVLARQPGVIDDPATPDDTPEPDAKADPTESETT
ncbi:MAG: class I SAM-dependent methyltransferase [Myxococcota bacterium]